MEPESAAMISASKPVPSLGARAAGGALWQALGGGWQTLVRMGASVFLARALSPADFGIFGMALLAREFLDTIGALGMGAGIVAKKEVTQKDLATCFWTMAGIRTMLFLLGFFGAPLAGYLLGNMRMVPVLQVVSFLFLTSILESVSGTLLAKELKFRTLNVIQGAFILGESTLAVVLARSTHLGCWALVYPMLGASIGMNITIFLLAKWRPTLQFDRESFRYMFRFGINGLGFSLTNYLSQNIDYLLVGRILGAQALGLYEFAYRIPHLVLDRISRPVGSVVFPAFSKMRGDNERMLEGYLTVVKHVALVAFPLVSGLAGVADLGVHVLWGDQWTPIVFPLRILAVRAALLCIAQPIGAVFLCKDRPDLHFKFQFFAMVWTFLTVAVFGYWGGLVGVAWGMLLGVLGPGIILWKGLRMVGASLRAVCANLLPITASATICGVGAWIIGAWLAKMGVGSLLALPCAVIGGGLLYLGAAVLLAKSELESAIKLVKEGLFVVNT